MYIPGLQSITLNKIKQNSHQTHSNQSNSLAIEQFIIHSFFESLLMPERNENKPNYIEKTSTTKTESTLGKQQAREIRRGMDSEEIIKLRLRTIKEQGIIIDMIPKMI